MVSIELSFLEKLGWLLKEAKELKNFGHPSPRPRKNHHFAHGFARQKGQEVMDERFAFNACLKN